MVCLLVLLPFTLPSFLGFFAVGSEEARLRASLRPPLKLHVQFSQAVHLIC